jgi:hypothetical protein
MLFKLGARVRVVSENVMEANPDYREYGHDHSIPSEGASGIMLEEDRDNLILVYWDKNIVGFFGWEGSSSDASLLRSTGNRTTSGGSFYWVPKYSLELIGTPTPKGKFRDRLPNESEMNYRICKKVNAMDAKWSSKGGGDVCP